MMGHIRCLHNLNVNAELFCGVFLHKMIMMKMKVKLRVRDIAQSLNIKKDKKKTGRVQIALMIYDDCDLLNHHYMNEYDNYAATLAITEEYEVLIWRTLQIAR